VPTEPQATEVTIQTHGKDKYKRILADVFLPDGTHVNHTLVKNGWCWWYRKYAQVTRCYLDSLASSQ
jgi:endonuclease YncB( thermonuclease family)